MNTTSDARAGLVTSQETAQTVLLIVASAVGTWLGLYVVPWQFSGDPCLVAAAGTVGVVTCLWLTRWRGVRAVYFERNVIAGFLVAMPLVYVTRYFYASSAHSANYWIEIEVLGTLIFVALVILGLKRSPWFLALGLVLHGVAWDIWHYRHSTYIPDWYVIACLAVDLTCGAYVASRVPVYQKAARGE